MQCDENIPLSARLCPSVESVPRESLTDALLDGLLQGVLVPAATQGSGRRRRPSIFTPQRAPREQPLCHPRNKTCAGYFQCL